MHELDRLDAQTIQQRLQGIACGDVASSLTGGLTDRSRLAGVLIPLIRENNEWRIIYSRRAQHELDYHSGQVAFAGGKYERQDVDLVATALREAEEEIGLNPARVEVLGQLEEHSSITGIRILPVVARVDWPVELRPETSEVARIFSMPVAWLADEANYRAESKRINGRERPIIYYDEFDGELLWGATARMTLALIRALRG